MANKVFSLCDESLHTKNLIRIKEDLLLNSYPEKFIDRYINSQRKKWYNLKNGTSSEIAKEPLDFTKTIVLPSFDYCKKELKQFLEKKCNLNIVFYSPFKLDKIAKVNKDKNKIIDDKCIVYKVK